MKNCHDQCEIFILLEKWRGRPLLSSFKVFDSIDEIKDYINELPMHEKLRLTSKFIYRIAKGTTGECELLQLELLKELGLR